MRQNEVFIPSKINSEIAELIGAHVGDGNSYVRKSDYRLLITCNATKDKDYINFLAELFYNNFKIRPKVYVRSKNNSINLVVRSKRLHEYYTNQLKMPIGPKVNIDIPKYILIKKEFLIGFTRGLFDTDGCVSIQKSGKYEYPFISLSITSENLAKTLVDQLKTLGFNPYICITKPKIKHYRWEFSVRVKGYEQIRKWKEIISSHNHRNIVKLNQYG